MASVRNERQYRWNRKNPEKTYAAQKRWYVKNRETMRCKRILKAYGIDYNKELAKQNGACAICSRPAKEERHGHLHVDHNHVTGKFRGLLCQRCNHGIGLFGDNEYIILRAAEYVKCQSIT